MCNVSWGSEVLVPRVHVKCAHRVLMSKLGCLFGTEFELTNACQESQEGALVSIGPGCWRMLQRDLSSVQKS
jgi:hypothetical protein